MLNETKFVIKLKIFITYSHMACVLLELEKYNTLCIGIILNTLKKNIEVM